MCAPRFAFVNIGLVVFPTVIQGFVSQWIILSVGVYSISDAQVPASNVFRQYVRGRCNHASPT
jgi:hypothetical protein